MSSLTCILVHMPMESQYYKMLCFSSQIIFALVPPPSIWGGWLSFVVSLTMIGGLVIIIGDLATIFGCLVGLKDSVTAITFVALGTSLPDLFASKQAAVQEKYADNSIGNVTGSNSVNVFLGLGMPWLIAAIYWEIKVCDRNRMRESLGVIAYPFSEVMLWSISLQICLGISDIYFQRFTN